MDLESRIFINKDKLSINEMQCLNYISNNKKEVSKLSIKDLSERTFYSAGFISKLIKKLNYQGFSDFKNQIGKELSKDKSTNSSIELLQLDTLTKTKNILSQTDFSAVFSRIDSAENIYCFGTGHTINNYMREFGRNLMFVTNKRVVFMTGMSELESTIYSIKKDDVIIVASNTGENKEMLKVLFQIKNEGSHIINISPFLDSELTSLADFNIYYYINKITLSYREKPYVSFLTLNYCSEFFILEYISYKENNL